MIGFYNKDKDYQPGGYSKWPTAKEQNIPVTATTSHEIESVHTGDRLADPGRPEEGHLLQAAVKHDPALGRRNVTQIQLDPRMIREQGFDPNNLVGKKVVMTWREQPAGQGGFGQAEITSIEDNDN